MRGIAILAVIVVHSNLSPGAADTWNLSGFLGLGMYGVELFFFISGFLMSGLYDQADPRGFSRNYWRRRLARILPLWAIFGLLSTIGWLLAKPYLKGYGAYTTLANRFAEDGRIVDHPLAGVVLTLLFLGWVSPVIWNSTIAGGWSIQSEMFHYLAFWAFRGRQLSKWLVALAVAGAVFVALDVFDLVDPAGYGAVDALYRTKVFSTAIFFVAGIAFQRLIGRERKLILVDLASVQSLVSLAVVATCAIYVSLPFGRVGEAILFVFAAVLVASVSREGSWPTKFLQLLGKYSYFLYFFHFFVLLAAQRFFLEGVADQLASWGLIQIAVQIIILLISISLVLIVGLPVAFLSWRIIERPFTAWARRDRASR